MSGRVAKMYLFGGVEREREVGQRLRNDCDAFFSLSHLLNV